MALTQLQELISLMEERVRTVGTDLEEVNGCFYCHRMEINWLKRREELVSEIIGANHKFQLFKNRLEKVEENCCRCR